MRSFVLSDDHHCVVFPSLRGVERRFSRRPNVGGTIAGRIDLPKDIVAAAFYPGALITDKQDSSY